MSNLKAQANEISQEILIADGILNNVGHCIAAFGSARLPETDKYYIAAREFGAQLAKRGYSVVTGGGPGIMEAANRGAYENKGISIGLNITLAHEQKPNSYQTHEVHFDHFAARKAVFFDKAKAYVAFPGGMGTQDEIWEALTLIQCEKLEPVPIVLFGTDYWRKGISWMREEMLGMKLISPGDMGLFFVTDSVEEAVSLSLNFEQSKVA